MSRSAIIAATTLAFTLAVILGTAAAYAKSRIVDRLVTLISLVGVSVPHFWLAIVLVIIFAVELGALPRDAPIADGTDDQRDRGHQATEAIELLPNRQSVEHARVFLCRRQPGAIKSG